MDIKVELREIKPQPIASIRTLVKVRKIPKVFPELVKELINFLETTGKPLIGAPLAIFTNWKKGKGEMEVGIPVSEPFKSIGNIKSSELPGGKVAYVLYIGHLRKIASIYERMKNWAVGNGYEPKNIWWEVYLTNPSLESDLNKWKTEVYLLIN
ncbi:MAG: GyrI-like domain-containing protein [Candidatus Lokiarchaeota archaeon]|nr:GyrI-like domain-containing protein [Candidatus Lokiarchaeota archaeon]